MCTPPEQLARVESDLRAEWVKAHDVAHDRAAGICGCCQRQHMLQRGLRLRTHRAGKHGPRRRAHNRAHAEKQPESQTQRSHDDLCHRGQVRKAEKPARPLQRLQRNPRDSSSAGSKKMFPTPPPRLWWPDPGDPEHLPRPTVLGAAGAAVGSSAVEGLCWCDAFSPPPPCYCRSALTSRPCHGSMLAFLFPTSRDGLAAQLRGTGPAPPR